jgi:DNA-binding transcriptional ArsR family regulator
MAEQAPPLLEQSARGRDVETTLMTPERPITQPMEKALWYLFAGTRGGTNRVRIVRELADRPRNANELADELAVDYNTITHHIDMLEEHDVVEPSQHDYGKLYFLTDRFEQHRETFEAIAEEVD